MVQHEVAHEMNNAIDSVWTENPLLLKRWMLFKRGKVCLRVLSLFSVHLSNISKGFASRIELCLNFLILLRKMYRKNITKSFCNSLPHCQTSDYAIHSRNYRGWIVKWKDSVRKMTVTLQVELHDDGTIRILQFVITLCATVNRAYRKLIFHNFNKKQSKKYMYIFIK